MRVTEHAASYASGCGGFYVWVLSEEGTRP